MLTDFSHQCHGACSEGTSQALWVGSKSYCKPFPKYLEKRALSISWSFHAELGCHPRVGGSISLPSADEAAQTTVAASPEQEAKGIQDGRLATRVASHETPEGLTFQVDLLALEGLEVL